MWSLIKEVVKIAHNYNFIAIHCLILNYKLFLLPKTKQIVGVKGEDHNFPLNKRHQDVLFIFSVAVVFSDIFFSPRLNESNNRNELMISSQRWVLRNLKYLFYFRNNFNFYLESDGKCKIIFAIVNLIRLCFRVLK